MGNLQSVFADMAAAQQQQQQGPQSTAPLDPTPVTAPSTGKCPDAPPDGALSSPTYYSDPFSKFTTQNSIQSAGRNVDLYSETVESLQSKGLFITKEDFSKLVSILTSESAGNQAQLQDSVLKQKLESKTGQLLIHLELEYCFYYRSYSKLLSLYFTLMETSDTAWSTSSTQSAHNVPIGLVSSNQTVTGQKTQVLGNLASNLQTLNSRLTSITRLNVAISSALSSMIESYRLSIMGDETAEGSTAKLDAAMAKLQASSPKVRITQLETNRRSVEYTQEKNRYVSIYLGLYAFLNISALAVLLHIANSE